MAKFSSLPLVFLLISAVVCVPHPIAIGAIEWPFQQCKTNALPLFTPYKIYFDKAPVKPTDKDVQVVKLIAVVVHDRAYCNHKLSYKTFYEGVQTGAGPVREEDLCRMRAQTGFLEYDFIVPKDAKSGTYKIALTEVSNEWTYEESCFEVSYKL